MSAVIVGFGAVILSRLGLEPGYWPRRGAPPAAPMSPMSPTPPMSPMPQPYPGGPATESLPLSQPRWEEPGVYPQEPHEPAEPR